MWADSFDQTARTVAERCRRAQALAVELVLDENGETVYEDPEQWIEGEP